MRAIYGRLSALAALAAVLSTSFEVSAASKDAQAEDLSKKAIYTDYLGTKFPDAEKKLKQAIALCAPAGACSPNVQARLYCNLGIVYIGGMNKVDDGKAQFAAALKLDPSVAPDADLVSPEIEVAFKEAKGGGVPAPKPVPDKPAPPPPSNGNGDLVHTPPTEQATLTPVPLYAELPAGTTAARVQLSYRPFGAAEWKSLEMRPAGKGYSIEIPCVEVGSAQGDLAYFIQAFDGSQNLVTWSGTRAAPNKVAIRTALQGEPPHLPGQPPPARCADVGDCPPEFPGCHGTPSEKPACDPASPDCVQDKPPVKKNWLSIAIQQDFLVVPGNTSACAGGNGYDCFDSSNTYYSAVPFGKSGDQVQGGMSAATTRLLVGYDRVIVAGLSLGARVGYAFRGGPTTPGLRAFFPGHIELRATYTFLSDPFSRTGPRPYLVLDGGVAEVDGSVGVKLYKNATDYAANTITNMTAWRKDGLGFIGGGIGVMLAVKPWNGPFLEAKLMELLGSSGTAINLQIGYAFGL